MKKKRFDRLLGSFCLLLLLAPVGCRGGEVKEPAVAGAFYPGDARELQQVVDSYLAKAELKPSSGKLLALISPHAGYQFSGLLAAQAYRQLQGSDIRTVVLIGPSHRASFPGVAVYAEGGMRTPLGTVAINERAARSLLDARAGITFNRAPFAQEHSLEVQLPFLQRVLPKARIVPVLIGAPTRESFTLLTERLVRLLKEEPQTMLVVSSDFSHFHDTGKAKKLDMTMIDAIERLSANDLQQRLMRGEGEMCGGFPALVALNVVRQLGGTNGLLYSYADSSAVGGDPQRVVGYAAMGLYRTPLDAAQKRLLVSLARESITAQLNGRPLPQPEIVDPLLKADGAVFVTLNDRNGQLRGCIGSIMAVQPLYRSVIGNAVSAAIRDHRFPPVTPAELPGLHLEVTVLSPMEQLADIKEIKIGKHGLLLEKDGRSSVFLPQVPVEQGWDIPTYLQQLARKAGLPENGWQGAKLSSFTAEIIKE